MRQELVKSLLLIALVVTSVFFTWRLWTYQTNYETYTKSTSPRSITIANSFKLDEVVRPYLFIYHHRGEYLGTQHRSDVDSIYQMIKGTTFDHITLPASTNEFPKQGENPDYEIVFPGSLTKHTLIKLFSLSSQRLSIIDSNVRVDRIKLFKSLGPSGNIIAVFQNGPDVKFYAMVDEASVLTSLEGLTNQLLKTNALSSYFITDKLKKKEMFLPLHPVQAKTLSYIYVKENAFKFVEAYFNDPENALHGDGIYSDGVHQLKEKGQVILYLNPTKDNVENEIDPILQSFSFVNGHSGWTDDYIYEDVSTDSKTNTSDVTFRMQKGDYPVFSTGYYPYNYASEIELRWERGYLHQIGRTLLNLNNYDIDFPNTTVTIKSGDQVLDELSKNEHVKLQSISDLKIGYALDPFSKSATINLVPTWFYKQGDSWYPITQTEQPSLKKNIVGGK